MIINFHWLIHHFQHFRFIVLRRLHRLFILPYLQDLPLVVDFLNYYPFLLDLGRVFVFLNLLVQFHLLFGLLQRLRILDLTKLNACSSLKVS